ncbi:MAG TPA: isoprenylcysteine carboxylmethyltransferase family protein [Anaerolineaceae bacterium]|nr:isoprenylcysteine carboxylmethyltransferase family protein [Anaerolineaceae bacterium]
MKWIRHLISILLLPGLATIAIPIFIWNKLDQTRPGWSFIFPLNLIPIITGLLFILAGLILLYQTISLFARVGNGTLAPWDPTESLVSQGIYRYVRNPMITGVFSILLGEAILTGSQTILVWFVVFVLINLVYIPYIEEPGLVRRFGEDYKEYCRRVPRWIPDLLKR